MAAASGPTGSTSTSASSISIYGAEQDRLSPFWRAKYEREAGKHWDVFYKRNQTNFFKDRHYLDAEFDILKAQGERDEASASHSQQRERGRRGRERVLLEVGCGVGNTVFPLLSTDRDLRVYCCDFSKEAVRLVNKKKGGDEDELCRGDRLHAFVCDVTKDDLLENVPERSVDIVTLIFVISAIPPNKLKQSIENICKTLKPGAQVLVRDYAAGDLAEVRLEKKKSHRKLDENYYIRGDGTFVHYFTEESLKGAFETTGFTCLEIKSCDKEIENRKRQLSMKRHWLQAVFQYDVVSAGDEGGKDETVAVASSCEWENAEEKSEVKSLFEEEKETQLEEIEIAAGVERVSVMSVHRENIHSEPSTGTMVWSGSRALSRIIVSAGRRFESRKVIELGSGCSPLCAIALGEVKADQVVATDGNPLAIEMLEENLALNAPKFDSISSVLVKKLAWNDTDDIQDALKLTNAEGFDVAVASDVLYIEDAIVPLFLSAGKLLAQNPSSFFLVCYTPRRAIEERAILAARKANMKQTKVESDFEEALETQNLKNSMRMLQFCLDL